MDKHGQDMRTTNNCSSPNLICIDHQQGSKIPKSTYYPLDSDTGISNCTQTGPQDSETGIPKPTNHPQDSDIGISNCIHNIRNFGQQDYETGILGPALQMEKFLKTLYVFNNRILRKESLNQEYTGILIVNATT